MNRPKNDEILSICMLVLSSALMILLAMVTRPVSFLTTAGAGSILLAIFALYSPGIRQELIFLGFAIPFSAIIAALANSIVTALQPHTVDAFLSQLDGGVSVAIYHWTLHHPRIYLSMEIPYIGLPLFTALVLALTEKRMACFRASLLAGIIAPVFYYLVPAIGPAAYGMRGTPRNCFPSLHLTWALELVIFSRSHLQRIAVVYLIVMAVSTLGLGEHYIVDLLAAVPYTLGINWIERRLSRFLPVLDSTATHELSPALDPEGPLTDKVEIG